VQVSLLLIAGVSSFLVAIVGAVMGNVYTARMIGAINRKRREGEDLVSQFGFTPWKLARIHREYRSSYPDGRLHIRRRIALVMLFGGLIGVVLCVRIAAG
jgi:hypothetical protein